MMSHEALGYATCSLRCLGFLVALPLGDAPSMVPRIFLAVGLGIALHVQAQVSAELSAYSLLPELVVGFILGAPIRFIADLSEMIGELIDTARGQTIAAVIDPLHGQGASDLAVVAKHGAVACALHLGALELSLQSLARSTQVIPLGGLFGYESLVQSLLRALSFLVVEGLQLGAVWMGAFLLIDLGCAVASRLTSGLSFSPTAGLVKLVATLLLLLVIMSEGSRLSWREIRWAITPWVEVFSMDSQAGRLPSPASDRVLNVPSTEIPCDR